MYRLSAEAGQQFIDEGGEILQVPGALDDTQDGAFAVQKDGGRGTGDIVENLLVQYGVGQQIRVGDACFGRNGPGLLGLGLIAVYIGYQTEDLYALVPVVWERVSSWAFR